MSKITQILAVLRTPREEYHGFRLTRCRDGKTIEAQCGPGCESNILFAIRHNGKEWSNETYYYYLTMKESELFGLPYSGTSPEDIRSFVAKEFRKRRKYFCLWRLPSGIR